MNGDEWLVGVFRPALSQDSIGHGCDADNLRGQIRALHDCGVLTDEAHDAAEAELDASVEAAWQRLRLGFSELGTTSPAPTPAVSFLRVLAVGQPLAEVADMPLLLTSIESWSHRVDLFFAAVPSVRAVQEIADHEAALNTWHQLRVRRLSGQGVMTPPPLRGDNLNDLDIRLRDDVGTSYVWQGGTAGGSNTEWQAHRVYQPGIPADAELLIIEAADADTRIIGTIEVQLTR